MKYAAEMSSGAMIYIPSLNIGSGIQKSIGGIHRQDCDRTSLPPAFTLVSG
jgi:hypothetical protein